LHVYHVFMAQAIEFARGYAGLDEWRDVIENFGTEAPGNAHACDVFSGFNRNIAHRKLKIAELAA
jgi:hypothetical protein